MSQDLAHLGIAAARRGLLAKDFSPKELLSAVHQSITARNPALGAYLNVDAEAALAAAESADLGLPLGGIPIAIKDNINVQGQPVSCASRILQGSFTSPYDATAVLKLKAAGAIPFGRTNMDEFAMGSSTENSALLQTVNPHDATRVPGGSSGGSAAAVGGNIALAALGSDTGGSIRQPAAFCGCVGLKPSYGRVSRYGLVAYASSLDQIGPITKSVEDAALLLQAIAGGDLQDTTSLRAEVPDYTAALSLGVKGMRIGLPKEYFGPGIHPDIRTAVDARIQALEKAGATIKEISLPHTEFAIATYYIIATAEASANLARFDGVRYGHRCENPQNMPDLYARSRAEGFGPEVKRRILLGTYVLSSGYYDAYYLKAQKVRTLIMRDFLNAFREVDVIACPTTPQPAWVAGSKTQDPLEMYLQDIYTIAANLSGVCGISLPVGTTSDSALPVGLQFMAPSLGEATLLQVAAEAERV